MAQPRCMRCARVATCTELDGAGRDSGGQIGYKQGLLAAQRANAFVSCSCPIGRRVAGCSVLQCHAAPERNALAGGVLMWEALGTVRDLGRLQKSPRS